MADARTFGELAAQDEYSPPERAPVRITVRPQMEVTPPKSFEDYLGEATQPREADPLQRPPVFGLTNRYVDPNDPITQAGAQRLSNYYGLPGRLWAGDPRNVIQPEVPGQWSDRDEARAALQAGNMTLGGMGMGVDATTGAMPRGFAGATNTLGAGGGRPPRMGAVVEPPAAANVNTPTIAGLADRIGARIRDNPMAAEPALSPFDQARLAAAAKRSEQGLAEANARLGPNPTPEEFKAFALRPFPKDPQAIRREVDYRDPSGRPTRTAPLPIGTEQAILGRGYDVATGARAPGPQPPLMQAAERKGPIMGETAAQDQIAPAFYSAVEQTVTGAKTPQAPGAQWLGTLRNAPGVKPEELQRLGLEPWLAGQQGPVPKQTLADYIAANKTNVGEVQKIDKRTSATGRTIFQDMAEDPARLQASPTKFSEWQLPGGENYRETLLTLPARKAPLARVQDLKDQGWTTQTMRENEFTGQRDIHVFDPTGQRMAQRSGTRLTPDEVLEDYALRLAGEESKQAHAAQNFTAGHYDEPNVLVHYRTNDRTINGKKTLFLEEVQSDWHQKGREQGYTPTERERQIASDQIKELRQQQQQFTVPGSPKWNEIEDQIRPLALTASNRAGLMPDAPFKTTWHELALKRAIRDAAEGGYEQIAWTPGSVQNERYGLSKHVKDIETRPDGDNTHITINAKSGVAASAVVNPEGHILQGFDALRDAAGKNISDVVGKDVANRILNREGRPFHGRPDYPGRVLEGLDLEIGGEGMKGFYDKMLPAAANKLGKKYGAQVGQAEMESPTRAVDWAKHGGPDTQKTTIHTLPITPQLRETALYKGFPMYVVGGATTMGALASQGDYRQ